MTSAKLSMLLEMLPELLDEGRRILLFSQFTSMLGLIEEPLKRADITYSKLTGQTRKRDEAIDALQEKKRKLADSVYGKGKKGSELLFDAETIEELNMHNNALYCAYAMREAIMSNPCFETIPNKSMTLGEAVLNAGAKLGLSPAEVGQIVGRNRTTIVRNGVDPSTPNGQLALLLVRVYRGLYVLVGGREDEMVHWMRTRIRTLNGVPAELINNVTGLVRVVEYLDAIRGKT